MIQFWGNHSRRLCVDSSLLNFKFVGGYLNHKVAVQLSWQSYDHCDVLHFCWVKLNRTYCGDSLSCLNFYRWDVLLCTDWNGQLLDFQWWHRIIWQVIYWHKSVCYLERIIDVCNADLEFSTRCKRLSEFCHNNVLWYDFCRYNWRGRWKHSLHVHQWWYTELEIPWNYELYYRSISWALYSNCDLKLEIRSQCPWKVLSQVIDRVYVENLVLSQLKIHLTEIPVFFQHETCSWNCIHLHIWSNGTDCWQNVVGQNLNWVFDSRLKILAELDDDCSCGDKINVGIDLVDPCGVDCEFSWIASGIKILALSGIQWGIGIDEFTRFRSCGCCKWWEHYHEVPC